MGKKMKERKNNGGTSIVSGFRRKPLTMVIANFQNCGKPSKLDWGICAAILFIAFFISTYGDIGILSNWAQSFWKCIFEGRIPDFFQVVIENKTAVFPINYEFPAVMILGTWYFPVYLLEQLNGKSFLYTPSVVVWQKMMFLLLIIATAVLIYRICLHLSVRTVTAKWTVLLFLSSLSVLIPCLMIAHLDILSVFLTTLGFYYYLKEDNKKFLLWFALAIPIKMYAVFVFVPLVLLREKRILYIIRDFSCGMSALILSKLLFLGDPAYHTSMDVFGANTASYMLAGTTVQNISVVCALLIFIAIYCFCQEKDMAEEPNAQKYRVVWIYALVFQILMFFLGHRWAYYYVLAVPGLVLILALNPKRWKQNTLLEIAGTGAQWIWLLITQGGFLNRGGLAMMPTKYLLEDTLARPGKYTNLLEMMKEFPLSAYPEIYFTVYFCCISALLWLNRPSRYTVPEASTENFINRGFVWCRFAMPIPVFAACFAMCFILKPAVLLDTTGATKPCIVPALSENSVLKEGQEFVQTFSLKQNTKLETLYLTFQQDETIPAYDCSSIDVELIDSRTQKQLFKENLSSNKMQLSPTYEVDMRGLELKADTVYEIHLSGKDDEGRVIRLWMSNQLLLEEPLLLNGKEQNHNLWFKLEGKTEKNNPPSVPSEEGALEAEIEDVLQLANPDDEMVTLEITVKNTGTAVWSEESNIRCGAVDSYENSEQMRAYIAAGRVVDLGESYTFRINVPTFYLDNGYMVQMVKENVMWFGREQEI